MSKRPTTREALGIFWGGEEVEGFTAYGYWPNPSAPCPELGVLGVAGLEVKASRMGGYGWTVWLWDVRIRAWPKAEAWAGFVAKILQGILDGGATVAWCAVDGAFADPPALFDPAQMPGGVWAARFEGGQLGLPALDEPFDLLTEEELLRLKEVVAKSCA